MYFFFLRVSDLFSEDFFFYPQHSVSGLQALFKLLCAEYKIMSFVPSAPQNFNTYIFMAHLCKTDSITLTEGELKH